MLVGKSSSYRFLRKALYPFRAWILLQIGVIVSWAVIHTGLFYCMEITTDTLKQQAKAPINTATLRAALQWPIGLYVSLLSLSVFSFRIHDVVWLKVKPYLRKRLSQQLMVRLVRHDHFFYRNNPTGALGNQVRDIIAHVPELLEMALDTFLYQTISIGISIFFLACKSWAITLTFLIWVLVFLGVSYNCYPRLQQLSKSAAKATSVRQGHMVDVFRNQHNVRLCNGQHIEQAKVDTLASDCIRANHRRNWFMLKLYLFQSITFIAYVIICVYLLYKKFAQGAITTGVFLSVLSLTVRLLNKLWRTTEEMTRFASWMGHVRQALHTILAPHATQDQPHAKPLQFKQGVISFKQVYFGYPKATKGFKEMNITLPSRKKIGLVGYSGSGKTTFINLIARLFDPQKGVITVDGQNIKNVTQESLHEVISIIPQSPTLFNRTLFENIHYGCPQATSAQVYQAARRARAHEFIMNMPAGYASMVGEEGLKISGGQRQRIAIARAMLKDAPILILDESTSQLDAITEAAIQQNLAAFMKQKTVLIIAHRLNSLLHTDHILVFDDHRIVESGTHTKLIATQGLYHQLWQEQVGGFLPDAPLVKDEKTLNIF